MIFYGCMIIALCTFCSNGNNNGTYNANESTESNEISSQAEVSSNSFEEWFYEFQEANPHWTQTTEGQQKLVNAFKNEMISNLDFAKSICMKKVFVSECITSYDREDGEYGGVWAFVIRFPAKLKNPLYNGQTDIDLACEIISMIPSTAPHDKPYTANANYSDTFGSYHKIDYPGTLNLGSYVVTKKDK